MESWDQFKTLKDGNLIAAKLQANGNFILSKNRIDILYYLNVLNVNLESMIEILNEAHFLNKSKIRANWILAGSGAGNLIF